MTFGSTKPTSKTQRLLKLQWDCADNGGASRKLVDTWVQQSNNATRGTDNQILNEAEHLLAAKILQDPVSSVIKQVQDLLHKDLIHFMRVRNQLLSLLVAWEQIILEKKRYDEEGFHPSDNMEDLSPHQFLILFRVVWGRAQAGLTDLAPSPANSTAPTIIKRSIESGSPPAEKRARSDSRGGAGVSGEASGQKRRADEQGGDESSTERAKLDK
ncbi:hypothetical protein F5B18DRAFT_588588 [Nemania serpens]|nr:hypothetical protein F5B18DRAFT_588588 [Nemania serpens]